MPLPDDLPADAHGDALRRLLACGDDLTRARPVEFAFVFARIDDARGFGLQACSYGFAASASSTEVIVAVDMAPSYAAVTTVEAQLAALASEFDGRPDGWGCFSLGPDVPPGA